MADIILVFIIIGSIAYVLAIHRFLNGPVSCLRSNDRVSP